MPPSTQLQPIIDTSHMLPAHTRRQSSGPVVGVVIIMLLLIFGGLYFWGAALNAQDAETLPLIPGDSVNS